VRGLIERIVVPLDAAAEHRAALDTAARLARRWGARLHGVFVEDSDLIHLSRLPFARQFSFGVGIEQITEESVERQLRAFAAAARRDVEAAARRYGVEWSFEIAPGAAADAALIASERDLLVAGSATRPVGTHFRVECRWWQTLESADASFLVVHCEWAAAHGAVVTLLRDREPASLRVLDAAAHCAAAIGGVLTVACSADLAATPGFKDWLGDRLAPYALHVQIELAPDEATALLERFAELDCALLVLGAGSIGTQPGRLRQVAAHAACGLLIVR
jgi:nucleotide-binding universal stress UspA family protein